MTNTTTAYPLARPIQKKPFDFNLETLRGVAAILVVWGHATVEKGWIDPNYYPKGIWSYLGPAHLSVLVFFLLSGYVIGINHKIPLAASNIPLYLKKRFTRIYPIYVVCLLLALLVSRQHYSTSTIIGHLTLTQGILSPFIDVISPAWSLSYEAVFYLLFIPISVFRVNPIPAALLAILLGCADAYLYPQHGFSLLPSFAFGFAFWLSGLALARYLDNKESQATYAFMLSFLFLFMAIGKLDAPVTLFHQVSLRLFGKDLSELPNNQPGVIALRDFGYLPYCVMIVIIFSGKEMRYQRFLMSILLLLPAPTLYYYYRHLAPGQWSTLVLPILFYGLALILFMMHVQLERISMRTIKSLIITGSISYGLYIVHYPILYLFGHNNFFSGTSFTFLVRLICFLVLAVSGAYLLEKKFQPWIKKLFF